MAECHPIWDFRYNKYKNQFASVIPTDINLKRRCSNKDHIVADCRVMDGSDSF